MNYLKQYVRDVREIKNLRLFYEYHVLLFKVVLYTKLLGIDKKKERILGYTVYHDNLNSLFAMFTEIFIYEVYGNYKTDKHNPLIIDCGSNIGISVIYFKHKFPESRIICFEPDRKVYSLLVKNTRDFFNVTTINGGVGEKDGYETFYTYNTDFNGVGNSFIKSSEHTHKDKIRIFSLKELCKNKVDLLKLDIEGYEYKTLKGIGDDLKNVSWISLEYHYMSKENSYPGLLSLLEDNNFYYIINNDRLLWDNIDINFFLKHNKYAQIIDAVNKGGKEWITRK